MSSEKISLVTLPCLKPGDAVLLRAWGSDDHHIGIIVDPNEPQFNAKGEKLHLWGITLFVHEPHQLVKKLQSPFFRKYTRQSRQDGQTKIEITWRQESTKSPTQVRIKSQYQITFFKVYQEDEVAMEVLDR